MKYARIKVVSIVTGIFFVATMICPDCVYSSGASQKEIFFYQDTVTSRPYDDPTHIVFPTRLGYIDDVYKGSSGRIVFHIKDAHCNYDAQKSIYGLIDWIVKRYNVRLINLEGGSGKYDLSVLEDIQEPSIKKQITDEYLRKGRINGAELYRVFNSGKVELAGIEQPDLYDRNLRVYRSILAIRPLIDEFLNMAEKTFNESGERIFSLRLKTFERNRALFDSNRMELGRYITYLLKAGSAMVPEARDFSNLKLMARLILREREIDFKEANRERERLVGVLLKRLSRYEKISLLSEARFFNAGISTEERFYKFLIRKCREVGIKEQEYPQLARYMEYLSIYRKVDETCLFEEITEMEKALSEALCESEEQKKLLGYIAQTRLLKKMFSLRLDRSEFETARKEIDLHGLMGFLKTQTGSSATSRELEDKIVYVAHGFSSMIAFYMLAERRDLAFMDNIVNNMGKAGVRASIVITGGFHAENLCRLLKENDISYVSINPAFTNAPAYRSPYMELLSGVRDASFYGQLYPLFASTIQIKSLWSQLGIDTDFITALMFRLDTALKVKKREKKEGIIVQLGDTRVLLIREMNYKPASLVRFGKEFYADYAVIDLAELSGLGVEECRAKILQLVGKDVRLELVNELTGGYNMAEVLKHLLFHSSSEGARKFPQRKKGRMRVDGGILEKEVRGPEEVDTFHYTYDLNTGVLTCHMSSSVTLSRYMIRPSVVSGNNEKAYLCDNLRRIFAPATSQEEKRRVLQDLLNEQRAAEKAGKCGWEWMVSQDEEGNVIVDDARGYGLKGLRLYDRSKMPEGYEATNLVTDASIYGGEGLVHEMDFYVNPGESGNIVNILMLHSWGAKKEKASLRRGIYMDHLTRLHNRKYLVEKVLPNVASEGIFSVLFIDLDDFKPINDTYGHRAGDAALKSIARVLRKYSRGTDVVIRFGGDEFLMILPGTNVEQAKIVGQKIIEKIQEEAQNPEGLIPDDEIRVTIGVTEVPFGTRPGRIQHFIDQADEIMRYAKENGRKHLVSVIGEDFWNGRAGRSVPGLPQITQEGIKEDIAILLDDYIHDLVLSLSNLEKRVRRSQEIVKLVSEKLTAPRFLNRIRRLEGYLYGEWTDEEALTVRRELNNLYYDLAGVRAQMSSLVSGRELRPRDRQIWNKLLYALDVLSKYRVEKTPKGVRVFRDERDEGQVSYICLDREGNSIKLPSFQHLTVKGKRLARKDSALYPRYAEIPHLLRAFLEQIERMFESEIAGGFSEKVLTANAFSRLVSTLLASPPPAKCIPEGETSVLEESKSYLGSWLSRLTLRAARFPQETRVMVYPVYSRDSFLEETKMMGELRHRLAKGDYGFRIVPLPYLAGDRESREQAWAKMEKVVAGEETARALIYTEGEFFDQKSGEWKDKFGGRVICIKEEGTAAITEGFTYLGFGLRCALSLAVIDYFDERNRFSPEHRERLEDLIASMLALINGDSGIVEVFKDNPKNLIKGLIVLKPAECIAWQQVQEKVEAARQFLHSL